MIILREWLDEFPAFSSKTSSLTPPAADCLHDWITEQMGRERVRGRWIILLWGKQGNGERRQEKKEISCSQKKRGRMFLDEGMRQMEEEWWKAESDERGNAGTRWWNARVVERHLTLILVADCYAHIKLVPLPLSHIQLLICTMPCTKNNIHIVYWVNSKFREKNRGQERWYDRRKERKGK